jgi:hypothetical protein
LAERLKPALRLATFPSQPGNKPEPVGCGESEHASKKTELYKQELAVGRSQQASKRANQVQAIDQTRSKEHGNSEVAHSRETKQHLFVCLICTSVASVRRKDEAQPQQAAEPSTSSEQMRAVRSLMDEPSQPFLVLRMANAG